MLKRVLFLAIVAAGGNAAATETYRYNVRGNAVEANLFSDEECGGTDVWLYVSAETQKGRDPWSGQLGSLYFSQYDWCTGESRYGYADLSAARFESQGERGATLAAEGLMLVETPTCDTSEDLWECEWSYEEVAYALDLVWAPTETSRGVFGQRLHGEGFSARFHGNGSQGYGPVHGVLEIGDVSLDGGWGTSSRTTSGSMSVTHL